MHALTRNAEPCGAGGQSPADESRPVAAEAARTVHSEELLQGRKAVEISHNGAIYRLQATRLGKLILTK